MYVFSVRTFYEPIKDKQVVKMAGQMINVYYEALEELYGESAYTNTIHAHLHLCEQVLSHGPLHGCSHFFFEVN